MHPLLIASALTLLSTTSAHPLSSLFNHIPSIPTISTTSQSPLLPPNLPALMLSRDSTTDSSDLILSDVLSTTSSISIFASLTRSVPSISSLLSSTSQNATVLAPSNSVLAALPRKPWEAPSDYESLGAAAYAGAGGEGRAQRNLDRFVEAHVVRVSPWVPGKEGKTRAVGGEEVWVEEREGGRRFVMPDGVEVVRVADKVVNGEVWVLGGVVNYDA